MPALVITIGNPLRRDDGVAHHVRIPRGIEKRAVLQLTPELASQIAPYDAVIFIDADVSLQAPRMKEIHSTTRASRLTHVSTPHEIVALARALYRFTGRAFVCRIPVTDLGAGEGLSRQARRSAERAGREVYKISQSYANRRSDSHPVFSGLGRPQ